MSEILGNLYQNLLNTSWVEIVAVIFGILSVWYARKENVLVYPIGIVNVLIYVYLCYHSGLYADMGINIYYFLMSVFGWYNWTKKRGREEKTLAISKLNLKQFIIYTIFTTACFIIIYFILIRYTDSSVPILDSFTTALFITAMLLQALKKIENWIFYILGNIFVIPLFAYKGLVFSSIQYIVFLVIAVMGYIEWDKRLLLNKSN